MDAAYRSNLFNYTYIRWCGQGSHEPRLSKGPTAVLFIFCRLSPLLSTDFLVASLVLLGATGETIAGSAQLKLLINAVSFHYTRRERKMKKKKLVSGFADTRYNFPRCHVVSIPVSYHARSTLMLNLT